MDPKSSAEPLMDRRSPFQAMVPPRRLPKALPLDGGQMSECLSRRRLWECGGTSAVLCAKRRVPLSRTSENSGARVTSGLVGHLNQPVIDDGDRSDIDDVATLAQEVVAAQDLGHRYQINYGLNRSSVTRLPLADQRHYNGRYRFGVTKNRLCTTHCRSIRSRPLPAVLVSGARCPGSIYH